MVMIFMKHNMCHSTLQYLSVRGLYEGTMITPSIYTHRYTDNSKHNSSNGHTNEYRYVYISNNPLGFRLECYRFRG